MRLKLRKIGNSYGVLIPRDVITESDLACMEIVITFGENVITKDVITKPNVITPLKIKKVSPKEESKWDRMLARYGSED